MIIVEKFKGSLSTGFIHKVEAPKADNANWWEAMKSPFADEYWKAAVNEIETLEKIVVWDVVHHVEGANVVGSTWVFIIKHYPDGHTKKFRLNFVLMEISKVMAITSLRPML